MGATPSLSPSKTTWTNDSSTLIENPHNTIAMKKILTLILAIGLYAAAPTHSQAQDLGQIGGDALAGGAGYMVGNTLFKGNPAATAATTGGAILLADFGQTMFARHQNEDRLRYYNSGANYQRWIQSQKEWYTSTLDPYTGRPPAFNGLGAMDDSMPKATAATSANSGGPVYVMVTAKVPQGNYDGVNRTARVVQFPRLP